MPIEHAPTSAEARGRLRLLWAALEAEATTIEAAVKRVPPALARDVARKFGKGAEAAVGEIVRRIPARPFWRDRRSAGWRYLRPVWSLDRHGVLVRAVFLNAHGHPGLSVHDFGLEVSYHALGRLLDRSSFRADPATAVLEAHSALLALEPDEGECLFRLPDFLLPAAGGAFLLTSVGRGNSDRLATARTWIDGDLLWNDQQRHVDAWKVLTRLPPAA